VHIRDEEAAHGEDRKWNLLVVDDNETICALLSAVLNSSRCSVSFATSADIAMQQLHSRLVDICFLDLVIPGVQACDLLLRIRRESPSTKIIVATGVEPDGETMQTIRDNAVLFLMKPFDLFLLEDIVREIMENDITTYQEYGRMLACMAGEKRRHDRQPFSSAQTFSLLQPDAPAAGIQPSAAPLDISMNGLGIRTNIPLEPGRMIRLSNASETICGIVRWSNHGDQVDSYRAGIQFVKYND